MKRRVLSKTTPFHPLKKKKKKKKKTKNRKEQNGVVLNDTVHLLPPIMQRGRRKKFGFNLNSAGHSLAWSPPTGHNGRPPTAHLPENRGGGGPSLGSRAPWPTGRLLPMLHSTNPLTWPYK
jgi:hypothetical protein